MLSVVYTFQCIIFVYVYVRATCLLFYKLMAESTSQSSLSSDILRFELEHSFTNGGTRSTDTNVKSITYT